MTIFIKEALHFQKINQREFQRSLQYEVQLHTKINNESVAIIKVRSEKQVLGARKNIVEKKGSAATSIL